MLKKIFLGLKQYSNKLISEWYIKNKNTGIGDILFQISSGLYYAYLNNAELIVPSLNIYFKLEKLDKEKTIFKYINTDEDKNYDENKMINFEDVRCDIHKINFINNIHIKSYFINLNNFHPFRNTILKYFSPNNNEKEYLFKKYPILLEGKDDLCSIHVRKGTDYDKLFKKHLKFFEKKYFLLLDHMIEKKKVKNYFVLSNDKEYCKKIFDNNFKYKDINFYYSNERDYYDIWIISLIKNNIVSSSHLSWWGSYLNNNEDKYIILSNYNNIRTIPIVKGWKLI